MNKLKLFISKSKSSMGLATLALALATVTAMDKKHPTKSPGIAAGVKNGRMQSASEIRNCTGPKLIGWNAIVSAT